MLSHLLQRCNEEQLELCEGVLDVMKILVESGECECVCVRAGVSSASITVRVRLFCVPLSM